MAIMLVFIKACGIKQLGHCARHHKQFSGKDPQRAAWELYSVLEIKTDHHSPDFVPEHSQTLFFVCLFFAKS